MQGWGYDVTTTGYGSLYGSTKNEWYTSFFNGTSSASPMVAASAALLQSVANASTGQCLTPAEVRTILRNTGTPQADSASYPAASYPIGPQPNLRAALDQFVQAAPETIGVTPSDSTLSAGQQQTFAAVYSDANGAADIARAYVWFRPQSAPAPSVAAGEAAPAAAADDCLVQYTGNRLYLWSGSAWLDAGVPGAGSTVNNGLCYLYAGSSSVSTAGNTLTLNLRLHFRSSFTGTKDIYLYARDGAGAWSSVDDRGDLTVQGSVAPTTVSVAPSNATVDVGAQQTFAAVYADANGAQDIGRAYLLVNSSYTTAGACFVQYTSNTLYLWSGSGWLSAGTPGSGVTVNNGLCDLYGASSSVSTSGNQLTVNFRLSFRAGFAGAKNLYLRAKDNAGLWSPADDRGDLTVQGAVAPTTVSVTPSNATVDVGAQQTFAAVYADANGAQDIGRAYLLVNSSYTTAGACFVQYTSNRLYLWSGSGWLSAGTPGSGSTVNNGLCDLYGASSSVSTSGDQLTVNYRLSFRSGFVGSKNLYLRAKDSTGLWSAADDRGDLTVQGQAPSTVSVTPNNATLAPGELQTFTALYSDANGAADIARAYGWFRPQSAPPLSVAAGEVAPAATADDCLVQYTGNRLYLWSGSAWLDAGVPGAGSTVNNGQCYLYAGSSSVSTAGNTLTLNLRLHFRSSFTGAKDIYLYARDSTGAWSSVDDRGDLTVQGSVAPTTVSVTPSSATVDVGAQQTFAAVYSDANGAQDIGRAYLLINSSYTTAGACFVQYTANKLYLWSGSGWLSAGIPGSGVTVSNGLCDLYGASSSVSTSGDQLTVNFRLSFRAGFVGSKNLYLRAKDSTGLWSPADDRGDLTVQV